MKKDFVALVEAKNNQVDGRLDKAFAVFDETYDFGELFESLDQISKDYVIDEDGPIDFLNSSIFPLLGKIIKKVQSVTKSREGKRVAQQITTALEQSSHPEAKNCLRKYKSTGEVDVMILSIIKNELEKGDPAIMKGK